MNDRAHDSLITDSIVQRRARHVAEEILVHQESVGRFLSEAGTQYESATSLHSDFYICGIGDGVRQLKEEI